jgi:hypothetical protein
MASNWCMGYQAKSPFTLTSESACGIRSSILALKLPVTVLETFGPKAAALFASLAPEHQPMKSRKSFVNSIVYWKTRPLARVILCQE